MPTDTTDKFITINTTTITVKHALTNYTGRNKNTSPDPPCSRHPCREHQKKKLQINAYTR